MADETRKPDKDDDDVPISVSLDVHGRMVHSSQAMDYYYRSASLERISFFEFAYFCEVQSIRSRKQACKNSVGDEGPECESDKDDSTEDAVGGQGSAVREKTRKHRLVEPHPLALSHVIVDHFQVYDSGPVKYKHFPRFVGAIPSPGSEETYWMFILSHFKPFSCRKPLIELGQDLRTVYQTNEFTEWNRRIIDNLDAMHECEDERDRQYMQRNQRRETGSEVMTAVVERAIEGFADEDDGSALHVVEEEFSHIKDRRAQVALTDLLASGWLRLHNKEEAGSDADHALDVDSYEMPNVNATASGTFPASCPERLFVNTHDLRRWPKELKQQNAAVRAARRNRNNLSAQTADAISARVNTMCRGQGYPAQQLTQERMARGRVWNASELKKVLAKIAPDTAKMCEDDSPSPGDELLLTLFRTATQLLDAVSSHNKLNTRQRQAFLLIARQWIIRQDPAAFPDFPAISPRPLRVFLSGPGGTGKTHCLGAVKDVMSFFDCGDRLAFYAPTGSAAVNVGGVTLHKGYGLKVCRASTDGNEKQKGALTVFVKDSIRMDNKDIDVHGIDEVSLMGCEILSEVEFVCRFSREGKMSELFGGAIMVFSGDLLQHGPVGATALYTPLSKLDKRESQVGIMQRIGRMVWAQLTDVVELTENMRMRSDPEFADVVGRIRTRECTSDDVDFLNSRVILSVNKGDGVDMSTDGNQSACALVGTNLVRQAINMAKATVEARNAGEVLHVCAARDTRDKIPFKDDKFHRGDRTSLLRIERPAGNRNVFADMLPGFVPIYVGMPVVYRTKNLAVELGVANGSQGVVVGLDSEMDESSYEIAKCVLVRFNKCTARLTGLPIGVVPVFPVKASFQTVAQSFDKQHLKAVTVTRSQLPIQPAFAITSHSAEGKTMPKVLVDFHDDFDKGGFAPYVGVSRVQRREDLAIMRPVTIDMLNKPMPAGLRDHMRKLHAMAHNTLVSHGFVEGDIVTVDVEVTEKETLEASYRVNQTAKAITGKRKRANKLSDSAAASAVMDEGGKRADRTKRPKGSAASVARLAGPTPGLGSTSSFADPGHEAESSLTNQDVARGLLPGCLWTTDYTCGYDTLLMIILYTYFESSDAWCALFSAVSATSANIIAMAQALRPRQWCANGCAHDSCVGRLFDKIRDAWRDRMSLLHPHEFPRRGPNLVSIDQLADSSLHSVFDWTLELVPSVVCSNGTACGARLPPLDRGARWEFPHDIASTSSISLSSAQPVRLDDYVRARARRPLSTDLLGNHDSHCNGSAYVQAYAETAPPLIQINGCYSDPGALQITMNFLLSVHTVEDVRYVLRGIIYHGGGHFTSRFLFRGGWWAYDGATNGGHATYECACDGPLLSFRRLESLNGRCAYKLLYALAT